ncbi:MAG: hypothetical protein RIQ41_577 [Candidatus Parcubacteria bacterium]|jgi:EAL domain-containing protein (putative c-di-GMP-specific phosphodiesterase class I)
MKDNKATFSKADIREGLEYNQFEVYYQPIIDILNNQIVSAEALIRWNHPKLGFLHPEQFITDAEKTGMIGELGIFVMREACDQSARWKKSGYPFHAISINLSLSQLSDVLFARTITSIIKETHVHPQDITLELTESVAMTDPEITITTLIELKYLGVAVSLDDFGAGYSSLSHLQYFPVDELKIDGQFIQQSKKSPWGEKLMRSISMFAQTLGLDVVVEGVETEEQLELVKQMKVKHVQGFYFTYALPAQDYKEWCMYYLSIPALQV